MLPTTNAGAFVFAMALVVICLSVLIHFDAKDKQQKRIRNLKIRTAIQAKLLEMAHPRIRAAFDELEPHIPTAMEDWDAEFKARTGIPAEAVVDVAIYPWDIEKRQKFEADPTYR